MTVIHDARWQVALQRRIHLPLDGRHLLKVIQVVPEIVAAGHSSQVPGGMFNAVTMTRRPQQHGVEGLRRALPLHGHRQMSFHAR